MGNLCLKYSWDIESFKKRYNEIINILSKEILTEKMEDDYNYELDILELFFDPFEENSKLKMPYLFFNKEKLKNEIINTISKKTNEFQRSIIIESSKTFKTIKTRQINYKYLDKTFPLKDQIELIYKNFSFNEALKKTHITLFDPLSRQCQISSTEEENSFIFYNNKGYIVNKNNETLLDFYNLCHETGHHDEAILTSNRLSIEYDIKHNYKIWLYIEVYSIFYELLSIYFSNKEKIINEDEKNNLFNDVFNSYINGIDKYLLGLRVFYKNKITPIDSLILRFSNGFEKNNSSIYYYSYLIAVNLFEQFLKDEEKALYNLNYLINNITPKNEIKILNYTDTNPEDLTPVLNHINQFKIKKNS